MKTIHSTDIPITKVHKTTDRRALIRVGEMKSCLQTFNEAWIKPGESFEPHAHEDCEEVFYVLSGEATLIVDNIEYPLKPKDIAIVEAGEVHSMRNTGTEEFRWLAVRMKG